MTGWIKLHRKLLDNPIFLKPELLQLFIYCLLRANHSETKIIWNGEEETLEKGCFLTGRKVISRDTEQGESAIYKRLKILEKSNVISLKSNNRFSVVKVLNYSVYQGEEFEKEQPSNNKVTTKEQQSNTDKNVKKYKNDKKYIYTPEELEILSFWNEKKIIQHSETEIIQKEITKALKKPGREIVLKAIQNYATLLHDEEFFYSHMFALDKFLKQKNGMPEFMDDGQAWINYRDREKKVKQKQSFEKGTVEKDGKYEGFYL